MTEPVVLTAVAGGISTITMNRPKALNALNRELTLALREAVFAAEQNKAVRCVVLKGGEHFMAGGDLKWFHENLAKYSAAEVKVIFEGFIQEVHAMIISIRRMPKPVIASISGAAVISSSSTCPIASAESVSSGPTTPRPLPCHASSSDRTRSASGVRGATLSDA